MAGELGSGANHRGFLLHKNLHNARNAAKKALELQEPNLDRQFPLDRAHSVSVRERRPHPFVHVHGFRVQENPVNARERR
jgi:hypothetical protein